MRTVIVDGWPPEPRLQFDIYVVTTGWHCMCVCVCVCVCSAFLIASWWTSLRSTPSYRSHPPQYAPNASARSRSAVLNAPPPAPLPPAPLHYLVFDYLKGEPRLRRHTPPFVTQDGLGWIDAPGVPATLRLVALPPSSTTGDPTAGVMRIRGRGVSGDASCCGGVTAGKDGGMEDAHECALACQRL